MRVITTFGAGPAQLPREVLHKIQEELVYNESASGISVLEMSHRSADFKVILSETERLFREHMNISNDYSVLFMHGGGSGQFAAVPLNLQYLSKNASSPSADYLVTGSWSDKAAKEAEKYLRVNKVLPSQKPYTTIPEREKWTLDPEAAYVYYCDNETIHGIEFPEPPVVENNTALVADISSNILSRPFDVSKHTVVVAGTQKNLGAAGLTVTIVKKDVLGHANPLTPSIFDYDEVHKTNSIYNTPPVFNVYVTKLVLEWIRDQGGPEVIFERNRRKSSLIYDIIDSSDGFYTSAIDRKNRSQVNVPFRIGPNGGDEKLETEFLKLAEANHMISLKGHRSVGGIRVSLYNSVSLSETEKLAELLREFKDTHSSAKN